MALADEGLLRDVVSSVVTGSGYDLEDLTVIAAGRRRLVRVVVDRDAGVDLDAAAAVSREISQALDARGDAVLGGAAYTLEVTSPGVGRPLTEPRHFRRAAGRLVTMTLADGSSLSARILLVADGAVTVLTGADGLTRRTIPLADIARAKVEVEFSAPSAAVTAALVEAGVRGAGRNGGPDSDGDSDGDSGADPDGDSDGGSGGDSGADSGRDSDGTGSDEGEDAR